MTANLYGSLSAVDWLNVKTYGATGNGSTDDTVDLQAAINAVGSGGDVVYLPAGTYLISSPLSVATAATILVGDGAENTKILIGSSFSGTAAVSITGYNCQIRDLSISGQSSTTTSNPIANAIEITGVRRAKVTGVTFFNVNGWCVEATATSSSGNSNPLGTQLSKLFMNACAGGIHFLGNTTQGYAVNSQISDVQFYVGGVTSGASANLDGIRIEDSWDVLTTNAIVWMSNGTGSSYHVKGNCAASFAVNLDALGPSTGPCVLIEDGPNGSPQNTQITGGVIQQGSPGLTVSGGANQVHLSTLRFISNQTHGITVSGTSKPIHIHNCLFNLNGAGASGTNYDINWSGTAQGKIIACWFGTNIVTTGSAGVQESINIGTAGQAVLVEAAAFQGSSASSANWFTNTPAGVLEASSGAVNFPTSVMLSNTGTAATLKGTLAAQPSASGNTVLSSNISGTSTFDTFRLTGDGKLAIGPGGNTATRDTFIGRANTGVGFVEPTLLVGSTTALGDNGSGEIQLADVTTVPTTNPSGGSVVYSQSGSASPLKMRDTAGNVRGIVDAFVQATANQSSTATSQTASTYLTLAVEASATYVMELCLIFSESSASGIFTPSWTGPSGATMQWCDTGTSSDYSSTIGATNNTYTGSTATRMAFFKGPLVTSTTAGSLTLTFATNSTYTATVYAGSYLKLTRMK